MVMQMLYTKRAGHPDLRSEDGNLRFFKPGMHDNLLL